MQLTSQGSRKPLLGHPGQEDFMLLQATFSNHLPTRKALTHSMKMKAKGINFKSLKIREGEQVEECLRQVAHEVHLADGQVEVLTFF